MALNPENIGIVLAPSRSGTTALAAAFAQNPNVYVWRNPLKSIIRERGHYLSDQETEGVIRRGADNGPAARVFLKMTFGLSSPLHCEYKPFPENEMGTVLASRTVALLRDPLWTLNSWIRCGKDPANYVLAYKHVLGLVEQWNLPVVTYEHLVRDPEHLLRILCERWGIGYTSSMLSFDDLSFNPKIAEVGIHETIRQNPRFIDANRGESLVVWEQIGLASQFDRAYTAYRGLSVDA